MDCTLPEKGTTETTTTAATSGTNTPTKSKRGRSEVWDHFDKVEPHSEKRAKCKYCGELIRYQSGTTGMWTHLTRCLKNPNREKNKRRTTSSNSAGFSVSPSPTIKFDQKACQMKLVKMFVKCELPFRFAENEDFCELLLSLQPRFEVRSRFSLRRDILELYNEEKKKLKNFLSMHCGRVCLTTDTWTSIQNINYMTLTAHFVDNARERKFYNHRKFKYYLGEVCENYNKLVELDLLQWWKVNSTRFPILASMIREVLAIPVSTVASECAFSTGGMVVSPYQNSLAPKTVEALICTQDWLKGTSFSKLFDEDCKEIEEFEQEATFQDEVAPISSTINLGD